MVRTDEIYRLDPIVLVRGHVKFGQDVPICPNLQDFDYGCIEIVDLLRCQRSCFKDVEGIALTFFVI